MNTNKSTQSLNVSLREEQGKDKKLILNFIIKQVELGSGQSISVLKKKYTEEFLFAIALKHVTTTKKALCMALNIPVEGACRYKRTLEKNGNLVQSIDKFVCPYTRNGANLLSTNPKEFERLLKSNNNQLKLNL